MCIYTYISNHTHTYTNTQSKHSRVPRITIRATIEQLARFPHPLEPLHPALSHNKHPTTTPDCITQHRILRILAQTSVNQVKIARSQRVSESSP